MSLTVTQRRTMTATSIGQNPTLMEVRRPSVSAGQGGAVKSDRFVHELEVTLLPEPRPSGVDYEGWLPIVLGTYTRVADDELPEDYDFPLYFQTDQYSVLADPYWLWHDPDVPAWILSQEVGDKTGEWFQLAGGDRWHAVWGRYENMHDSICPVRIAGEEVTCRIFFLDKSPKGEEAGAGGIVETKRLGLLAEYDADIERSDVVVARSSHLHVMPGDKHYEVKQVMETRWAGEDVSLQCEIERL